MKTTKLEFNTLAEYMAHFKDEATCRDFLAATRWRDGQFCPHCCHNQIYKFNDGKRYRCADCKKDFTVRVGTAFEDSRLPLRKWFVAIYLLSTSRKGISSYALAQAIGVQQKTAWFMAHRIRTVKTQGGLLSGTVEVDETYIGGKAKNMHAKRRRVVITGTGGTNKFTVVGARTRGGEVRAKVAPAADRPTLHRFVNEVVSAGSVLYSDEHRGYNGLNQKFRRGIVRHSVGEYVVGDCHTNSIESFWAVLKRGYHGVYHWMSRKHLNRYLNEFIFRFNRRARQAAEVFNDALTHMTKARNITFRELTTIHYEPTT